MRGASRKIQLQKPPQLFEADTTCGEGVARGLGLDPARIVAVAGAPDTARWPPFGRKPLDGGGEPGLPPMRYRP